MKQQFTPTHTERHVANDGSTFTVTSGIFFARDGNCWGAVRYILRHLPCFMFFGLDVYEDGPSSVVWCRFHKRGYWWS